MAASVRCDETGNGLDCEEGDKVVRELVAEKMSAGEIGKDRPSDTDYFLLSDGEEEQGILRNIL